MKEINSISNSQDRDVKSQSISCETRIVVNLNKDVVLPNKDEIVKSLKVMEIIL